MSTTQLAHRLGLSQSRIARMEKSEVDRTATLETLDRAARALGCRVVYALVPEKSLSTTVLERANLLADQQLASVEQTMRLEDQTVDDIEVRNEARQQLAAALLRQPARLWDDL
jgi:predicted DNA-binding mobile mystery protein A